MLPQCGRQRQHGVQHLAQKTEGQNACELKNVFRNGSLLSRSPKMWDTSGSIPHRRTSINRDTCQEFPHISRGTVQKRRTAMCGAPNQLFLISKMTAWIIRATPESLPRPASPLSYPPDELSATMWTSPSSIRLDDGILF